MKETDKMNMEWFITEVIDDFKNLQAVAELFLDVFLELSYNNMDECHALQYKQLCSLAVIMGAYVREFESKLGALHDYEELVSKTITDTFFVDATALPVEGSCCLSETKPPYLKVYREKKD